jgi:hypothetical protein
MQYPSWPVGAVSRSSITIAGALGLCLHLRVSAVFLLGDEASRVVGRDREPESGWISRQTRNLTWERNSYNSNLTKA